jgi:hypothetical protein
MLKPLRISEIYEMIKLADKNSKFSFYLVDHIIRLDLEDDKINHIVIEKVDNELLLVEDLVACYNVSNLAFTAPDSDCQEPDNIMLELYRFVAEYKHKIFFTTSKEAVEFKLKRYVKEIKCDTHKRYIKLITDNYPELLC